MTAVQPGRGQVLLKGNTIEGKAQYTIDVNHLNNPNRLYDPVSFGPRRCSGR